MGLARKKSAQRHQQVKVAAVGVASKPSAPSLVQAELLVMVGGSTLLLTNSIDNVQATTYSAGNGKLALDCHFLVLFSDSVVSGFRLLRSRGGLDGAELSLLETTAISSPALGALHPSLEWATKSRFVVNTTIAAPGLVPGDLLTIAAQVGDELRPVSRIYITGKAAAAATEGTAS